MTSTAGLCAKAAVPDSQQAVATTAAAAKQLRELAHALETQGPASAVHVIANLQLIAQQLQLQQPIPTATAEAATEHTAEAPSALASTAAAPTAAAAVSAAATSAGQHSPTAAEAAAVSEAATAASHEAVSAAASPAADVVAFERSYAATAVPGAADTEDLEPRQPLTKKQRRAAKGGPRVFDITKYARRTVVLRLMYVGWSYHGFARQSNTDNTIEGVLLPTLKHVKLIAEDDLDSSSLGYSRCGRTDKGVSALGQVLTLNLRSAVLAGQPLPPPEAELDYPLIINRALPDNIRVLGWTDLPNPDFNARFSCSSREYKYFIVQEGTLDVEAMRTAAQALLGEHDFRHFCKADVLQVQNFMRRVKHVSLDPVDTCCPGMTVLALHIKGTAFLWHQVRNIAAILLMVGRGLEKPGIVQQLLDIQRTPCKPQYNMAAEEPLLLYRCVFHDLQQWHCSPTALTRNLVAVNAQLQQQLVGAALMNSIYEQLQQQWQQQQQQKKKQKSQCSGNNGSSIQQPPDCQLPPPAAGDHGNGSNGSTDGSSSGSRWVRPNDSHVPLMRRGFEPSMEERFIKYGVSMELLNQPGAAALKKLEAGLL